MNRVLVTGGSGFIGRHLVARLVGAGHTVVALARSPAAAEAVRAAGAEPVAGDLGDPAALSAAARGAEVVVHLAGEVRALGPEVLEAVNARGAAALATAAARAGARRLVLVSSLAARGPAGAGGPVSAYGRSKLAGERAALAAAGAGAGGADEGASASAGAMECVVVRPTAVYGPCDRALLPVFRLARRGLRFTLAGAAELTLIHVGDLVRGLAGLVDTSRSAGVEGSRGQPLEVSDGAVYRWPDVIGQIAAAVGRPGPARALPGWAFAVAAVGADAWGKLAGAQIFGREKLAEMRGGWSCDPGRFFALSATRPEHDLASGFADTVAAYRRAGWL